MTNDQRRALFDSIFQYMLKARELPEGTSLDMRGYVEPVVQKMLDNEANELKKKIIEFAGSKRTVKVAELLKLLVTESDLKKN